MEKTCRAGRAWGRLLLLWLALGAGLALAEAKPVIIGLDADVSSASAVGGEAIRRGAQIAIAEINERGGVLGGRRLELVVKDHHGVPTRSTDNLKEFGALDGLVAVLGGVHSPAIIENHQLIHQQKLLMLAPWSAGTKVVDNGYQPNYVFRLSVRDEYAGAFLADQAIRRGYRRVGLLLEKTGWGRSSETAIRDALAAKRLAPVGVQWFHWGDSDLMPAVLALEEAGADVVILVANAVEGSAVVRAIAQRPEARRLPVIAHWGISGGRFVELSGDALKAVDLSVLQTYSFAGQDSPQAKEVLRRYREMFGLASPDSVPAPHGTAHAYDLVHILARAIEKAGTSDRSAIRAALEAAKDYSGLIRDYRPPFTRTRHEALTAADYRLARFREDGALVAGEGRTGVARR